MRDLNQSAGGHASGGLVNDTDQTINTMHDGMDDEEIAIHENEAKDILFAPAWIGNIRCYWHNAEGVPRLTIGPNWMFTFLLGAIVLAVLYLSTTSLYKMIVMGAEWYFIIIGFSLIVFGLWAFFATLLGDPGIPAEIYEARAHPNRTKQGKPPVDGDGFRLCEECNVYMKRGREHCGLCNVCIDECDHHCVFYSKCIGKGNIMSFRLSLVAFILNMTYFVIVYGFVTMTHKRHHAPVTQSQLNDRYKALDNSLGS